MLTPEIKRRAVSASLAAVMSLSLLAGCSGRAGNPGPDITISTQEYAIATLPPMVGKTEIQGVQIQNEAVALAGMPVALPDEMVPKASGIKTQSNNKAAVDYSNASEGYIMVQYKAASSKKLKCQVFGPTGSTYTYNLTQGQWETFPLSDGSGDYKIVVYEQISGDRYATMLTVPVNVSLDNEFAPFLRPNQYVNYTHAVETINKAKELIGGETDVLKKVEIIYDYVVDHITYDNELAMNVQSGYLPDLDKVLDSGKGICFDYAAVMAGMLRSQNVPTKLVVGYAGAAYHAWISVWSEETGWIENAIFFDGSSWQRMDPTFASTGDKSDYVMQFIGDGTNYQAKYMY